MWEFLKGQHEGQGGRGRKLRPAGLVGAALAHGSGLLRCSVRCCGLSSRSAQSGHHWIRSLTRSDNATDSSTTRQASSEHDGRALPGPSRCNLRRTRAYLAPDFSRTSLSRPSFSVVLGESAVGNWGSAIAKVIGINTKKAFFFQDEVPMYTFEEQFQGRLLHELINERHENPKYLPGIQLPHNIRADPDIRRVVAGAHVLVFVMPHQFIKSLCTEIQGHVLPGAKAISLVKGFDCENNQINLMSEFIRKTLHIECCSLSGANVAEGVAAEQFR